VRVAITLTQLRAFLAVTRTGSVHAAAAQLHVSQPSVSAAIAALGRELDVQLFERDGRGVRPTEAAGAFAPYAAQLLGLLEQGREAAHDAARPEASRIRVIAVNTAGEYLLPPLIHAYRRLYPGSEILLEIGNRGTLLERLRTRQAELGIGGRPPDGELEGKAFLDNELIVVGREVPADLVGVPWLLREEGSGTRGATQRFLAEAGRASSCCAAGSTSRRTTRTSPRSRSCAGATATRS
jgi:DNA-binding transcriptional LysR family regulator